MIALLTGTIRQLAADKAVIDVNGVGYLVTIHQRTSHSLVLGGQATLHTSMVVREDSMSLFAFHDDIERELFELLQTVTGIGPKVALAITASLSADQLFTAIASENVAVIEAHHTTAPSNQFPMREQLLGALTGLGFSAKESDRAISFALAQCAEDGRDPYALSLAELLKISLQSGKQ